MDITFTLPQTDAILVPRAMRHAASEAGYDEDSLAYLLDVLTGEVAITPMHGWFSRFAPQAETTELAFAAPDSRAAEIRANLEILALRYGLTPGEFVFNLAYRFLVPAAQARPRPAPGSAVSAGIGSGFRSLTGRAGGAWKAPRRSRTRFARTARASKAGGARCRVCGRLLRSPASIAAGVGPTCAGKGK